MTILLKKTMQITQQTMIQIPSRYCKHYFFISRIVFWAHKRNIYAGHKFRNRYFTIKTQDTALPPTIENIGPEEKEESDAADGVTMLDVLQDETELEEDAR